MPIRNASGASSPMAVPMRRGVVFDAISWMSCGVSIPNTTAKASSASSGTSRLRGLSRLMMRPTVMLPRPLNSSTVNSTTVNAYVGWPRKVDNRIICDTSTMRKPRPMPQK
jgi:hypothetical protein